MISFLISAAVNAKDICPGRDIYLILAVSARLAYNTNVHIIQNKESAHGKYL